MLEAELEAINAAPFTSIFLITLIMKLVMRQLFQLYAIVNKQKAD